jgi:hypothetical protein
VTSPNPPYAYVASRNLSRAPSTSLRDRLRRPLTEPVCRQVRQRLGSEERLGAQRRAGTAVQAGRGAYDWDTESLRRATTRGDESRTSRSG